MGLEKGVDLGCVREGTHMPGAAYDLEAAIGYERRQGLCNEAIFESAAITSTAWDNSSSSPP
jgi:hypothetical protein